ncbi:MAG TPA: CBS domain-containing protein [Longimicrobium sp.]|nr:CBS domain-containing protein [Longimicrobium sp.]
MQVRDIMTSNPTCCTPDDTVQEAARGMKAADCGCLPVVEDADSRRMVGVVTDRDIAIRALADGLGPDTRVRDVMTANPACCSPEADVREVERIMADRQVRRVPVVDESNCCVGMVAQADLARDERDFNDHEVRNTIERISEPNGRPQE